jgi:hypothetical protein
MRIPHDEVDPGCKGPHRIWNDSVLRPVPSADDVPGPRRCKSDPVLLDLVDWEKRRPIGVNDELGACFAGAVGIMTPQRITLTETPHLAVVSITLIAGHHYNGAWMPGKANRVKDRRRAHDIHVEGIARVGDAGPDDWLSRQMKKRNRGPATQNAQQQLSIADIPPHIFN